MQTSELEILVDGEYFRVTCLRRMKNGKLVNEPLNRGLAIQHKNTDEDENNSWENVCFVKPYPLASFVYLEDFNFKTVEVLDTKNMLLIEEYKNCVEFAKRALLDILGE